MNFKKTLTLKIFILITLNISAQNKPVVIPLWEKGAPGFEEKRREPEEAKDWWVKNIHNPSLTIFQPVKEKANGTAVIICPGGGFSKLVYNSEGVQAAEYLNSLGITAFVLKYRLFREENTKYTDENSRQDVFRAIRVVRSRAKEFNLDSARIGIMGFSAGGELAGWLAYHFTENHVVNADPTDAISARPAFQILVYPGPLVVPEKVPADAPTTFMVAANDDACCSEPVVRLLQMHREAKVPVEVHLFFKGDHAFNMGKRTSLISVKGWPERMSDWLMDSGIIPVSEK